MRSCAQSWRRRRGLVLELRPERLQGRRGAPIGDRILAQLQPDRERVWRQLLLERHRAIEPGKEELGLLGIELRLLQLGERAARQLEDGPAQPVAGDADEAGALLALAIGQVVRHPPGDILPFLDEIALRLEDGAADEGVETSPYLRHAPLEIERAALGAELLDQQLAEVGLDLVMAGLRGEVAEDVEGARALRHGRSYRMWPG